MSFLYPGEYIDSTYSIDFDKLYKEGYRGIIFDIDNTLVTHGSPADERAIALFKKLKQIGFTTCLISNNKEPRVKSFCDKVDSDYIFKAGKPLPGGYEEGIRKMKTTKENTLFIGDQIFTDVLGANRADFQYSCETDSPKRRDSDCSQTISGKNRSVFLFPKHKEKKC